MAILNVGRVGLSVELAHPRELDHRSSRGEYGLGISGYIKTTANTTTFAQTTALRTELLNQVGKFIALTYSGDSTIDGYYILESASLEVSHEVASLNDTGFFPYSLTLREVKSPVFETIYTGLLRPNDHSVTTTADKGIVGIPRGVWTELPTGNTSKTTYATANSSNVTVYYGIDPTDTGPIYSVLPSDYYDNAAKVSIAGYVRSGAMLSPTFNGTTKDVVLDNELVRVTAGISATNGGIKVEHYDGTAWDSILYEFEWGANDTGVWSEVYILRNDPEAVSIQLAKDRTGGTGRSVLEMTIYRGNRTVHANMLTTTASTMKIKRGSSEAATALASDVGIRATATDANGNRYMLMSPDTHSTALVAGAISKTTATDFPIAISAIVNAAGPDTAADEADVVDQYFNHIEPYQEYLTGIPV